ncbi:MAG: phage tail assembly chaperone [Pseudomonadota bacterium]
MAKITLGSRPKSFKKVVKFPMLDGTTGSIECIYKYRTRKEFGVFIDGLLDAAKVKPDASEDGEVKFSMSELMEKTAGANADYILQIVEGWNLDEDLSAATAQQLADEIPAAAAAIMETYRAAVQDGRLGN